MIVEFFKASVKDNKPTVRTKQFPQRFMLGQCVLLLTRIDGKLHIVDFHASREDSNGYAATLYGEFNWNSSFPAIGVGFKTPLEVVEVCTYKDQEHRNNAIHFIKNKYGSEMFGYTEPVKTQHIQTEGERLGDERYKNEEVDFNPRYSNDHEIGIVLGGYLDSNDRLIDRKELNRRIKAKDEEIAELKQVVLNLNDEGAKQSARDVLYTKFHDIVKEEELSPATYKSITSFMFSESDR